MSNTNVNVTSFISKYAPKKTSDILGNQYQIKCIREWLDAFSDLKKKYMTTKSEVKKYKKKQQTDETSEENEKPETGYTGGTKQRGIYEKLSCLFVDGKHGVGKTCIISTILKDKGYTVHTLDIQPIKTEADTKKLLIDTVLRKNVLDQFALIENEGVCKRYKHAILIDRLESITSTTERNCIMNIIKLNDTYWFCPIIFISSSQHIKFTQEVLKKCSYLTIYPLDDLSMLIYLNTVSNNESIKFAGSSTKRLVVENAQGDIRRLLELLHDLKYTFGENVITDESFIEYTSHCQTKDLDFELFTISGKLFTRYSSINECLKLYELEKTLLPLMLHENYIDGLLCGDFHDNDFKIAVELSRSLARGDIIDNNINGDQNWDLRDVHGFFSCVVPSNLLTNANKNKNMFRFVYPTDYNRTSIRNINKKKVTSILKCFTNMNVIDILNISHIIRQLLKDGNYKDIANMLKCQKLDVKQLDVLIGIDKTDDPLAIIQRYERLRRDYKVKQIHKVGLTTKQKKELQKYL